MPTNFLSLPRELRDQIYELVLVEDPKLGSLPYYPHPFFQMLTLGLLRANKTIHVEASSVFYSQNEFDLTKVARNPKDLASFLGQIGQNNAAHIQHIRVEFPIVNFDYAIGISDDCLYILELIQINCVNLSTLTTSLRGCRDHTTFRIDQLDHILVTAALKLVENPFKAISSLQEIIFEVYNPVPDYIRREIRSRGWTVQVKDYVEDDLSYDIPMASFDGRLGYSYGFENDIGV